MFTGIIKRNGSVSAEHGLGQQKAGLLTLARSPEEVCETFATMFTVSRCTTCSVLGSE